MTDDTYTPIERIRAPVSDDLIAVDATTRAELASDVALVNQVAGYILTGGGKRLRPLLVLLAARACGAAALGPQVAAAVIIEFIHTATLLHDDVVDGSEQRRGRHTAHTVFGNSASVLVGDFLYSRAFQIMVRLNSVKVLEILAQATNVIAEGEVLQLMNAGDPDTTEERYLAVIYRKTAKLFEAGAQVAAVVSGAPEALESALASYGRHVGNAFQLVDDALDYQGSFAERGKNVGDDLAEGKPTLPLIHALKHTSGAENLLLREAIQQGGLDSLPRVLAAIESTGGLNYTLKLAQRETDLALAALEPIPESVHKDALKKLAMFAVARTF